MQFSQCQWPLPLTDLNNIKAILTLSLGINSTIKSVSCLTANIVLPPQNKITVIKKTLKIVKALQRLSTGSKTSCYKLFQLNVRRPWPVYFKHSIWPKTSVNGEPLLRICFSYHTPKYHEYAEFVTEPCKSAVKISAHRRKDWIKSCLPQNVVRPQNHTNSNLSCKQKIHQWLLHNKCDSLAHLLSTQLTTFIFLEKGLSFNINHNLTLNVIHFLKK